MLLLLLSKDYLCGSVFIVEDMKRYFSNRYLVP